MAHGISGIWILKFLVDKGRLFCYNLKCNETTKGENHDQSRFYPQVEPRVLRQEEDTVSLRLWSLVSNALR